MDGWASDFSLLNYFFAERSLLRTYSSATSYSSSHLSGLLLLLIAPQLSATQFFASRSSYIEFSSLQLQSSQPPAAIPYGRRVTRRSKTTFRAAVTMCLATSSCNPTCQESRSITDDLLRTAVPMRFVTAGKTNLHTRSVTTNQPTFTQREQCGLL